MNPFASHSTETVPIDFDEGQTATIRKLTGREIEKAQAEHLKSLIAGESTRTWAASFQRQLAKGVVDDKAVQQMVADPLNGYDRFTLVMNGLLSWSYDVPLTAAPVDTPKGTSARLREKAQAEADAAQRASAVNDLDDDALEWFARRILQKSKPRLFDAQEAEEKKADGPASASEQSDAVAATV